MYVGVLFSQAAAAEATRLSSLLCLLSLLDLCARTHTRVCVRVRIQLWFTCFLPAECVFYPYFMFTHLTARFLPQQD